MCVEVDKEITRQLKRRKRPFKAWKELTSRGRSTLFYMEYGPGVCVCRSKRPIYCVGDPHGLHVWRAKGVAFPNVPVAIDPADIIAADTEQIAVRKLVIKKTDWLAAGLPKRPVKRRVI